MNYIERLLRDFVGSGAATVGGSTETVSDEFSRPANTTAYTAADRVSATTSDSGTTPLRGIRVARREGGSGYLTMFRLWTSKVGITPKIRVHFYTVPEPLSAVAGDNAAFPVMWPIRLARFAHIDLPALATPIGAESDVSVAQDLTTRLADAFTPDSGQSFLLGVAAEQN